MKFLVAMKFARYPDAAAESIDQLVYSRSLHYSLAHVTYSALATLLSFEAKLIIRNSNILR